MRDYEAAVVAIAAALIGIAQLVLAAFGLAHLFGIPFPLGIVALACVNALGFGLRKALAR